MRYPILALGFALLLPACPAIAQSPAAPATAPVAAPSTQPSVPKGVEDAQAYTQLVNWVIDSRVKRDKAVDFMRKRLRELSTPGPNLKADELAKRDLMVARREADIEYEHARRTMEIFWLEKGLTPQQRADFLKLDPPDQDALLESRSAELRLAVPLPPASFSAAPVENVLAYVQQESGVRVIGDWPSLGILNMKKQSPVSVEIGRYNRPAMDVLRDVVELLTKGQAKIELAASGAAIITTEAGMKDQAALQDKLRKRVVDMQDWDAFSMPLEPVSLEQVPLADALVAGLPKLQNPPLYVDWIALQAVGITPKTPVDLRLGVHTIGQRLAVLADAIADRPEVRQRGGVHFDVHPVGEIILSSGDGYRRMCNIVNRLTNVARTDGAIGALQGRMPEVVLDHVSLQDTIDYFRDATHIDIRVDWNSLAASGLTPQTPVDQRMFNVPLGFALAIVMDPAAGKPPVQWEVGDGKIIAHGGR